MDALRALAGSVPTTFSAPKRKPLSERLSPVIDGLAKSDPVAAQALRDKLDKAGQVTQSIDDALEAARAQKKELAKERVKQLREQFSVLQWFAAGDPKAAARQAAQMGKALKAAVKDYEEASRNDPARQPLELTETAEAEAGAEDGAAIRQRVRERIENLPIVGEGIPEEQKFASEAYLVRGLIQGLADFARAAIDRRDAQSRTTLNKTDQALIEVDEALEKLLEGQATKSVSVLV